MSSKRWFVVRSIKLNSGSIHGGQYLTKEQAEEIPDAMFRPLVRGVRLFDVTGEVDIPWRERNKLKLRHRAFTEIPGDEAKKLHDLSIEMMAQGRAMEFKSPREKALAQEIKQEKILEKKAELDAAEIPEEKPKRRRRRAKVEAPKEEPKQELDLEIPDV